MYNDQGKTKRQMTEGNVCIMYKKIKNKRLNI